MSRISDATTVSHYDQLIKVLVSSKKSADRSENADLVQW